MKAIPVDLDHDFGPLSVDREDLEKVLGIIQEYGARATIEDSVNSYDSLDEMKERTGTRPRYLAIPFAEPGGKLTLGGRKGSYWDRNRLYMSRNTQNGEHLFLRIRDHLSKRKRWMPRIFLTNQLQFAFIGLLAMVAIFKLLHFPFPPISRKFQLMLSGAGIYTLIGIASRLGGPTKINLEYRSKQSSFLQRNGDDLVKIVIGAILGGIITLLISHFTSSK